MQTHTHTSYGQFGNYQQIDQIWGQLAVGHWLWQVPQHVSSTPGHTKFIGKKQQLKIELFSFKTCMITSP